jgi:hypothetical protein
MVRVSAFATILLLAAVAHADPTQDAKAKAAANAGAALFGKNDFAGAAAKFEEAYRLNGDPSYLFNIAQAYRHSGDCARSADFYGRFLADVPHPPNEDKIRVWYASQLQCAKEKAAAQPIEPVNQEPDKQQPDKQEPTKQEPTKQEPTKQEPTNQEPTTQEPTNQEPAKQVQETRVTTSDGGGHPTLVLTLAATGALALGVGGFFAWDSGYLKDQRKSFLDTCTTQNRCSSAVINDYDHRGSRANTLAIVGFAAGGAAIAASATIYFVSGRRSSSSEMPPVAITPMQGGAIVTRGFAW